MASSPPRTTWPIPSRSFTSRRGKRPRRRPGGCASTTTATCGSWPHGPAVGPRAAPAADGPAYTQGAARRGRCRSTCCSWSPGTPTGAGSGQHLFDPQVRPSGLILRGGGRETWSAVTRVFHKTPEPRRQAPHPLRRARGLGPRRLGAGFSPPQGGSAGGAAAKSRSVVVGAILETYPPAVTAARAAALTGTSARWAGQVPKEAIPCGAGKAREWARAARHNGRRSREGGSTFALQRAKELVLPRRDDTRATALTCFLW